MSVTRPDYVVGERKDPRPSEPEDSCSCCQFASPFSKLGLGDCWRYPPQVLPDGESSHPEVEAADWCGEFKRKAR